jgi:uncharacterized repeat protein (TIGR01451 family)
MDGEPVTIIEPLRADLTLSKELCACQNSAPSPGQEVGYSLKVKNEGPIAVNHIQLREYVPAGMTMTAACAVDWTDAGNGLMTRTLDRTLQPGESTHRGRDLHRRSQRLAWQPAHELRRNRRSPQ